MVVLDLTLSPVLAIVVQSPELSNAAIVTKNQLAALIGSFWHESSATEPGGPARDGRAREPGAANIAAMLVAGAAPLVGVPQAGQGQCGGSGDHSADRSAVSGPALLWFAPDGGMAGDPGSCGEPQTGPAVDAAVGSGDDLSTPEHEQAGSGAQDLSLSAARAGDRAGQSGLVLRRRGCQVFCVSGSRETLYVV